MLAIVSPAKSLDYKTQRDLPPATRPRLEQHTKALINAAKQMTVKDLMVKMKISENLGQLNYERYQSFYGQPELPAIQVFDGDVYTGLDAKSMDHEDIQFAQKRLRILSGLYGMLRPLDLMRPYRLEMGTKRFPGDVKLSTWWEDRIAKLIVSDLKESGSDVIINLASNEYYASLKGRLPTDVRVIDINFLAADGRFITMHAKVARGTMTRWMIDNRIDDPEAMKGFDYDGYKFDADASSADAWTFQRSA